MENSFETSTGNQVTDCVMKGFNSHDKKCTFSDCACPVFACIDKNLYSTESTPMDVELNFNLMDDSLHETLSDAEYLSEDFKFDHLLDDYTIQAQHSSPEYSDATSYLKNALSSSAYNEIFSAKDPKFADDIFNIKDGFPEVSSTSDIIGNDVSPSNYLDTLGLDTINYSLLDASDDICSPLNSDQLLDATPAISYTNKMVAPLDLKVNGSPVVEIPKITLPSSQVQPSCMRGKTMHSFASCSLYGCSDMKPSKVYEDPSPIVTDSDVNKPSDIDKLSENSSPIKPTVASNIIKVSKADFLRETKIAVKSKPITKRKARRSLPTSKTIVKGNHPFWSIKNNKRFSTLTIKTDSTRAYELGPLPDPTLEKCRRNAVNAKKNREAKKDYIRNLENENQDLKADNLAFRKRVQEMEKKMNSLEEYIHSHLHASNKVSIPMSPSR